MRLWAALAVVLLALAGALVWSEVRKVDAPVGPEPLLNFIADGERELTHLPVAFKPLPDAEEIKIGNDLEKAYAVWSRQAEQEDSQRVIEGYVQQVARRSPRTLTASSPTGFITSPAWVSSMPSLCRAVRFTSEAV